ncbi:DUF1476 domain-containing protein [Pseudophaeobacter sp.]|uniref:DUF1476 domain-containing protein n=1 Tax=Pseudophaeobacter sp. TaxID=1971739 RepID=UPI00329974EB
MTTFDDREQAFEAKFAHDEELRFKARARCNNLLGLWAAQLQGLKGSDAVGYAATVVSADLQGPGHEEVLRKIAADLSSAANAPQGSDLTMEAIRSKMADFLVQAQEDLLEEV